METLRNIRILDFTRVLAGPYATRILADFGAEVIKVQSPKTAFGPESNTGRYFSTWNRNKRSITILMGSAEARELILRLVVLCDVVIENFSPRVMANWELTYAHLKQAKPDLIMLSMSGMGQTGPMQNHVAFGPTVQALGGLAHLAADAAGATIGVGYAHADPIAGLYGAFAVLAALNYRDQTGQGEYIDLSEYETVSTLIGPMLMQTMADQEDIFTVSDQSADPHAAPYGCYPCSGTDRWCVIAVCDEDQWQALCDVLGHPDWVLDEKFSTPDRRKKYSHALDGRIAQWTSRLQPETVVKRLQAAGVPAGVVQDARDLAHDPHLSARSFFTTLDHPVLGSTVADSPVIRFSDDSFPDWKAAPLLGEANQYVFRELLGLSELEYCEYVERGIIA